MSDFEEWYQQVERLAEGKVVGERLNLRPYYERGLSPADALCEYLSR